ncbi:ABC transporter ATP-binding protein [Neptunomonas qingdaonensis]|uniref:ABC-type dipeptide transporter n=1 Tax=Neptunomonas qingdaonensis TaxID=1045558 RepID=A0A1I2NN59_9GAMM|nr:ABC transporter ATP-binding protein [Neptunomonas qingdaonensis]SFG05013.1 peptide/nickel transport system ATP-binding protein [Neptunomonas qingdaonensis]
MPLLEVNNLEVCFGLRSGAVKALRDVSFTLERGERLGVVGESGAGKSVLGFSIINLLSRPGHISAGNVNFEGKDLASLAPEELRSIRGNRISMIFQDPMMTLNPVLTIGVQMVECLQAHRQISTSDAKRIALKRLQQVQIPSAEKRLDQYPHELSGGMRQRIVIAIGLLLDPDIIIADEPTTALDVTIQAEIMDLMLNLCEQNNVALILITHDLGVVSQVTQRMLVMYAGRIIEQGPTKEIINDAQHPYTQGLMNALPQMAIPGQKLNQIKGTMPPLQNIPTGCSFNPRCEYVMDICTKKLPPFTQSGNCLVACHMVADSQHGPQQEKLRSEEV